MKLSKLLKYILTPFMFQMGIDQTDDGDTIGTGNDARLKMYNQIADNNDKGRAGEFFEEDEEGNRSGLNLDELKIEDEEEPDGDETSEEEEGEEEPESSAEPEKKPLTSEPKKYKIKVNGVEKEVDESWLVETAQKVDSADDYLREAARLNSDAKNLRKPSQEETKPEVEEDDVTLARQIQMGSEEEAAAAIRKLRSPTGPSSDDLARTIDERLTFQKSVDWFKSEYKDIVSDPVLNSIAIQQDNMLRAQGDKRSYQDRYKAIGDSIRDWLSGHQKGPETEVTPEPETKAEVPADKKARKAAAPSVPKPASSKVKEQEVEESEESVQDTIAKMAQSRGGPQWMRG